MTIQVTAAGLAALSICESMLVSLSELGVIEPEEAVGILKDAAAAHRGASDGGTPPEAHQAAAEAIDRIIKGKNSVPHT